MALLPVLPSKGRAMALQFLVGGIVSVVNIMIHALVTVGAVGKVFVWALAYAIVSAAPAGSDLLYFAFVNYTTLGYGDVTPVQAWQLTGPMTAMNGILMFGWSTAVLFEVLRKTLEHLASIGAPEFSSADRG